MRIFKSFLLLLATLAPLSPISASVNKPDLIKKYTKQLESLTNARDSIRVLYYLFDLSDRPEKKQIAWQIYESAERAQDVNAQIDMIRNLAVFNNQDDSIVFLLQSLADKIQNKEARAATKTFIFNQHVNFKSSQLNDANFNALLLDSIVASYNKTDHGIYNQIGFIYQIIQYIGVEAEGSLFLECLDKYASLIDQLPESDFALKNQFYTTGAIFYSRLNGDQRRAVAYDKKLIEIMDMLQDMYAKKDRRYRNYDDLKFVSYRRMLSNFKVLSKKEIESIYNKIQTLAQKNEDVRNSIATNRQVDAYYLYSKGDFAGAIPFLEKALANKRLSVFQRIKLLDMLMHAAKEVGNNSKYLMAMEQYIEQQSMIDSLRKVASQREIMLRNTVSDSPLIVNDNLVNNSKKELSDSIHTLIIVSSLLAFLLIVYMVLYLRLKKKQPSL